jgi:flagellar basal body-associated protein FliL
VAGIILAILAPPLGLIFAIIGLVKSGARNGAGKALSIVAMVIALVLIAATIAGIVAFSNSTVADPGCRSAESSAMSVNNTMNNDDKAISADSNNPAAEKADLSKFAADSQSFITQLNAAQAQAQHQSVKSAIGKMSTDLRAMLSAMKAVENGNTNQVNAFTAAADKVDSDGTAIDQICAPFGGSNSAGG